MAAVEDSIDLQMEADRLELDLILEKHKQEAEAEGEPMQLVGDAEEAAAESEGRRREAAEAERQQRLETAEGEEFPARPVGTKGKRGGGLTIVPDILEGGSSRKRSYRRHSSSYRRKLL